MNEEKLAKKELKEKEKAEKKSLSEAKKEEKKSFRFNLRIFRRKAREEKRNAPLTEEQQRIRALNEAPKRSVLEEVGNAVSHGCGAIFAAIALVLMLLKSDTPYKITGSLVHGIAMFIMMLMSCLYHSWKHGLTVKRIWRRFDYCSIYLLIGGTFAPLQLIEFGHNEGHMMLAWIWFGVMWGLIAIGITFTSIFGPGRVKWVNFPLYFIIGWSGLLFIPGWWNHNREVLWWILGGGIVYTSGMIPFVLKKNAAHFIWHLFVLAGAIIHFCGIYLCVYM